MLFIFMPRGNNLVFQKIVKARHFTKKQETSWPQGLYVLILPGFLVNLFVPAERENMFERK